MLILEDTETQKSIRDKAFKAIRVEGMRWRTNARTVLQSRSKTPQEYKYSDLLYKVGSLKSNDRRWHPRAVAVRDD